MSKSWKAKLYYLLIYFHVIEGRIKGPHLLFLNVLFQCWQQITVRVHSMVLET